MTTATATAIRSYSWLETLRAYVALTKPRIIVLLLITTVPSMMVASGGWPSEWLILVTLVGGTLAAGGANAINMYIDRDIDRVMRRTRHRPIPDGRIEPERALLFGVGLGCASFALLAAFANLLAAALAVAALLFYVFVYTLWLKRTTWQNIVIGGAAGAFPPLVGWAAVDNSVDLGAWLLFAVIFFWTPPHFWALAITLKDDYAEAKVPMAPVAVGEAETRRQILIYTLIVVGLTLALVPATSLGWIYALFATSLNAMFLGMSWRLWKYAPEGGAWSLFKYSLAYLALLFVAMGIDVLAA
jgi:protoheme IX farnesyltransferase